MVLQAVEILVALAADLTSIWLFLLHANSTGIWYRSKRVHNGERSILVLFKLLILMTVLLVIFETVLVLVRLFATNDRTSEWLDFFREWELRYACTVEKLLFP